MSLQLEIIRASEFIRVGARGHVDLPASKATLVELVHACRKRGVDRAMLDLRELQIKSRPMLTHEELSELVGTFKELTFAGKQRLAILYRTDPYHRVRMFAFLSTMHGGTVRAFDDFEEALSWLSRSHERVFEPVRHAPGKTIPVRASRHLPVTATVPLHNGKGHHTTRVHRPSHRP